MFELRRNHPVVKRLRWKQQMGSGAKHIRPLLLVTSGGMRGVYGGGTVLALRELGLLDAFDVVVGISAGGPIAAYSLAGDQQAEVGVSVYLEECTGGPPTNYPFIALYRLSKIVDVDFLHFVFGLGRKRIDVEAVRRSRPDFYLGAFNVETRQLDVINAKTAEPDMLTAIKASMAIVGCVEEPVSLNGSRYLDGWLDPLPLQQLVERFQPTDMIVVPNCTVQQMQQRTTVSPTVVALATLALRYRSRRIVEAVLTEPRRIAQSLRWLKQQHQVNVGVLWAPDNSVHQLTTDPKKLLRAMKLAHWKTLEAFK